MRDEKPDVSEREPKKDEIYSDFDEFLKLAIGEYYRRSGRHNKANFIALLIASGEIHTMAMDSIKSGSGLKKLAVGAGAAVALRVGLKYALSGPLGIILTGVTAVSLISYFVRNRAEIAGKITTYRQSVADLRTNFEKLQNDHRDGRLDREQRNLMVDGLLQRFLTELDVK
jgi:hypothetical protein